MVGITSCAAYIPIWRISREIMGRGFPGERSVAGKDEDSLTMAVAAAMNCVNEGNREAIDAVFFASTTSPFKEKSVSASIAAVLDLRRDILTADFSGSLRAGTSALKVAFDMVKAGSARQVLVTAADCRLGPPGSPFEQTFGDGAAAVMVGKDEVIADLEFHHSIYDEIYDIWRRDVDLYVNSWEERFIYSSGYTRVMRESISKLLSSSGLGTRDINKLILSAPDARRSAELARGLGFDPKTQLQDPLMEFVGNTGCAQPLMLLAAAIEDAGQGDRLLMASYGSGSDAFIFKTCTSNDQLKGAWRRVKAQVARKKMIRDYATYLKWRQLLKMPTPRVDMTVSYPSAVAIWRETNRIYPLHGVKCKACGAVQYPPQRVCVKCQAKDNFEEVRLYDKKGKLFSFSFDPLRENAPVGLINLEGGGRLFLELTDVDADELKMDLPVELTFRRVDLRREDGMYVYFWKATPIRT
ncbi:MAG: 3-oxoacyl-[acyl-carrier-protein] synthase III C-terminal domain-containing protein [Candidatus Bathyarchaeia archaeon]